ncbi:putative protease Do-like 14 isoform X2 [Tripterygium wilfordii]|uniref:putative protease Do-like 14 isoform X2 n=1 Tax=Tripterygium wilfordii TaxID=458696 RepID=UPI0018F823B9|nr:putative protease Do-like 14 isoform X2 [Tripterygium wilfordii]
MNQLLRDASSSSARNSLIRIVSVAALGSHLLYANHYSYSRDRPSFYSRVTPAPSKDLRKEAPGGKGDSAKKYVGYIGRDTFADTVARVFCGITTGKSIGSGIIIDASGTILTCTHVVVDFPLAGMRTISKGKIEIALQDGRTFEGTVVNVDLLSDIATVKINSCKLGSSSKLRPGDWVLAMGCPPSLKNTVTAGVVSCADRKSSDLGHFGIRGQQREYLQTDCALHPGNSGGPLVNIKGEGVGVIVMKVPVADGLGFCVPIDAVSKIFERFNKSGNSAQESYSAMAWIKNGRS